MVFDEFATQEASAVTPPLVNLTVYVLDAALKPVPDTVRFTPVSPM
jgi:hypothetical protein